MNTDDAAVKEQHSLTVQFLKEIESLSSFEEKIEKAIAYMRLSLSQSRFPKFKDFWDVRKHCLDFFKNNINSHVRSKFWAEYTELSVEAKKLRDLLDEQSHFTAEQIKLAIDVIETRLKQGPDQIIAIGRLPRYLTSKEKFYTDTQSELNMIHALATQVMELRKEMSKIDPRICFKHQLFDRLSLLGNQIFPKRKKMIEELSHSFLEDVNRYVNDNFTPVMTDKKPFFLLREEIKGLQNLAKELTLNPRVFSETRTKMSSCWDQIKEKDKERKIKMSEERQLQQANSDLARQKIDQFKAFCEEPNRSIDEIKGEESKLVKELQKIDLGKASKEYLDQIYEIVRPFNEKKVPSKVDEKLEMVIDVEHKLHDLIEEGKKLSIEQIEERLNDNLAKLSEVKLDEKNKQQLDQRLDQIERLVIEKKQERILNEQLSQEERFTQLKEIYSLRKKTRLKAKERFDQLKKEIKSSGLDFQKALSLQELLDLQKKDIENQDHQIDLLENKMRELIS